MLRINTAFHNMLVHLGMGVLVAVVALAVVTWFLARRGQRPELFRQLDTTLYVMLFVGLLGIPAAVAGILVDYPEWTALLASPLVRIKALLSMLLFEVFLMMYYMRWKHGVALWQRQSLAAYFVGLSLVGAGLVSVVGSIGGFLAIRETALEGILQLFGIPLP